MKSIFINGHARAGTSWLAEMLSKCSSVTYAFEPFSSNYTEFSGLDTQTIVKKMRRLQYLKQGRSKWELLSDAFFLREGSPYIRKFLPHLEEHLKALPLWDSDADTLLIKQPRIESHYLFSELFAGQAQFLFIDRSSLGVVDSHCFGNYWSWVEEDWNAYLMGGAKECHGEEFLREASLYPWRKLYVLVQVRKDFMQEICRSGSALLVNYEDLCASCENFFGLVDNLGLVLNDEGHQFISKKYEEVGDSSRELIDTNRTIHKQADKWKNRIPKMVLSDLRTWWYSRDREDFLGITGDTSLKRRIHFWLRLKRYEQRKGDSTI
jgi:hypothetical protein